MTDHSDLARDIARTSLTLADRFDAGATMWCVCPRWPHHARHVAVEFVHPVVVGKPALPAVAVRPGPVVGVLRAGVRSGDVIVLIGPDDRELREVCRRAQAWGAATVWIGEGQRPPAAVADHVLWLEAEQDGARRGRFVLLYHLLWELTHVALEVPSANLVGVPNGEVCITCADEGELAEVVRSSGDEADVRLPSGQVRISTALVDPVRENDLVLVHAGTAIQRVEPLDEAPG